MYPPPILPGATLGVLGGGQLGRMFAIAAAQMGYRVVCYTPEANSPTSQICAAEIRAPFEDTEQLQRFAQKVDAVTIEFENVPAATLEFLQQHTLVRPSAEVLHIAQNRLREKRFLAKAKFPTAPFLEVDSNESLEQALKTIGTPSVLKTTGFGYDGKGQRIIRNTKEAVEVFASLPCKQTILERYITLDKEISVIGTRSTDGDFVSYGPIENYHRNHILDISVAPAFVDWKLAEEAIDMTRSIMEKLEVVGLLCVEFFVTEDKQLLVNELAPRPHNSGHLTIEACPTSQFEQQVRAITGLGLGKTEIKRSAAMANILGDLYAHGQPDWAAALTLPDVHLHLYGKIEACPGRKMGHLTACAQLSDEALDRVKNARKLLLRSR